MLRARATLLLLPAALLFGVAGARAHAVLDRAEPRVGSTVRTAPADVKLWFTERLEPAFSRRSEEHTSELQSQSKLVCRLLLEKKKKKISIHVRTITHTHSSTHSKFSYLFI